MSWQSQLEDAITEAVDEALKNSDPPDSPEADDISGLDDFVDDRLADKLPEEVAHYLESEDGRATLKTAVRSVLLEVISDGLKAFMTAKQEG